MASYQELEPSLVETTIGEDDESSAGQDSPKSPTRRGVHRSLSDRYSYRAAIYQNNADRMEYDII